MRGGEKMRRSRFRRLINTTEHRKFQKQDPKKCSIKITSQCVLHCTMFGMITFADTLTLRVMRRSIRTFTPRENGPPQDIPQRETHIPEDSYELY